MTISKNKNRKITENIRIQREKERRQWKIVKRIGYDGSKRVRNNKTGHGKGDASTKTITTDRGM